MDVFRQGMESIGLNPGGLLFRLALCVAAVTVLSAWSNLIARAFSDFRSECHSQRTPRVVISRLVLRLPAPVLWLGVSLNAVVVVFTLGLVSAREVMVKPGQSSTSKTTILVAQQPVAQITLGRSRHIQNESGHAFLYPVPRLGFLGALSDSPEHPTDARTVILENGRPLGPPHTSHETIRAAGGGAYSHWGARWARPSYVYFSTADNTNPLENDRVYRLEYVISINPAWVFLIILLSAPVYLRVSIAVGLGREWTASSGWKRGFSGAAIWSLGLIATVVPLLAYWQIGKTSYSIIGGFLPWSDASGWLYGAYYLLNTHTLNWWTARRPISVAFMSFLASLTGEDLRAMLLVRTLLTGAGILFVSREIWRRYGVSAGLTTFAVLVAFVSPFMPTTLTEGLGLAFGATAFALMWQAISRDYMWRFAGGLFLLTLAMSVRPGPVLVLPVLALWGALNFGKTRTAVWRLGLFSLFGVAAFVITPLWTHFYGTGESYFAANYSFTFYGLAFGGRSWQQFLIDHPEAASLPETAQATFAYHLAFAEVLRSPSGLLGGLWSFAKLYLENLFSYIEVPRFRSMGQMLGGIGLTIAGFSSRRDRHLSFLFWGAVGIVVSAPFIFWDTDAYRAFIVTAPFDAVVVGVGLATVVDVARLPQRAVGFMRLPPPLDHNDPVSWATTAVAVFLVLASSLAPVAAIAFHKPPSVQHPNCEPGLMPAIIHLGRSSPFIEVTSDGAKTIRGATIKTDDFHREPGLADTEIRAALMAMAPGSLLIHAFDLAPDAGVGFDRLHWMIASVSQMPLSGRYYRVCGVVKRFPSADGRYAVTFVKSAENIRPTSR